MTLGRRKASLYETTCPVCGSLGYDCNVDPERTWFYDDRLFGTALMRCYGCGTVRRMEFTASFDSVELKGYGPEAPATKKDGPEEAGTCR